MIVDVHKAQIMMMSKDFYNDDKFVVVPAGCTCLVQSLDVSINSVFKFFVEMLQNDHMHRILDSYIQRYSSSGPTVYSFSKCIGQACAEVSKNKEMIRKAFEKCGISVPIDGNKDEAIIIKGFDSYQVDSLILMRLMRYTSSTS